MIHPKPNQIISDGSKKKLDFYQFLSRYILQRVGEDFGVVVTFDPKVKSSFKLLCYDFKLLCYDS